MLHHVILAAAAAVSSTAGTATDAPVGTAAAAPTSEAAPAARPQRYCVVQQITGTMLGHRVCQTRDQWLAQGFDPAAPRR